MDHFNEQHVLEHCSRNRINDGWFAMWEINRIWEVMFRIFLLHCILCSSLESKHAAEVKKLKDKIETDANIIREKELEVSSEVDYKK